MAERRAWLVIIAAALAAGFFGAGLVEWRMWSAQPYCPPNALCGLALPPHRLLHPLRAEALWAMSGLFALLAVGSAARLFAHRDHAPTAA
jgi:hypothetical protein